MKLNRHKGKERDGKQWKVKWWSQRGKQHHPRGKSSTTPKEGGETRDQPKEGRRKTAPRKRRWRKQHHPKGKGRGESSTTGGAAVHPPLFCEWYEMKFNCCYYIQFHVFFGCCCCFPRCAFLAGAALVGAALLSFFEMVLVPPRGCCCHNITYDLDSVITNILNFTYDL